MDTVMAYLIDASLLTTAFLPPVLGIWLLGVSCTLIGPLGRLKYPDWQIAIDPDLNKRNEWRRRDGRMVLTAAIACFMTTGMVWSAIWYYAPA